MLVLQFIYIK